MLQYNEKAVSLYKNLGFEVSREFNYFVKNIEEIKIKPKLSDISVQINKVDLQTVELLTHFWNYTPSWQNSFESISRMQTDFIILGAYSESMIIGYCIIYPNTGHITQLEVDKENRRRGVALLLFKEALLIIQFNSIKIINVEIN